MKYRLNDYYFDSLENPEACYWLGVLTADGFLTKDGRIGIEITHRDREWLEKFKKGIEYEGEIQRYPPSKSGRGNGEDRIRIRLSSKIMYKRLNELGLHTDKTTSASFCNQVPKNNISHYIRGILDGDGSVRITKRGDPKVEFNGTYTLLNDIRDQLKVYIDSEFNVKSHGKIFRLSYNSLYAKFIVSLLYKEATVYLNRKKIAADKILDLPETFAPIYNDFSNTTKEELESLYNEQGSWNKVAESLMTDTRQLSRIRKRLDMEVGLPNTEAITKEQFLEAWNNHLSTYAMAEVLSVSERHIRRLRQKWILT